MLLWKLYGSGGKAGQYLLSRKNRTLVRILVLKTNGVKHMILSTIRMAIPVEKQSDALKILRSIALQTRDTPGCLSCCIYRDIENSNVLLFQEQWNSEERLALHVRSIEYRNILLVMEMSAKKPEVRFDTISGSTGIKNIEKIRSTICVENAK